MRVNQKLPLIIQYSFILIFCAACSSDRVPSELLITRAETQIQSNKYFEASQNLFIVCHRDPCSDAGKKAGRDASWSALLHIMNSKISAPKFIESLVLKIIAACNLIIAVDAEYAFAHDLHICKILAQFMLIRPYPDFDGRVIDDLIREINAENKQVIDQIAASNNAYLEHVYADTDQQSSKIIKDILDFLEYMQASKKYIDSISNKGLNVSRPSCASLDNIQSIINTSNSSSKMTNLILRSMLLQIEILAETNFDTDYLGTVYDKMEQTYQVAQNHKMLRKNDDESCKQSLNKANKIINFIKQNNHVNIQYESDFIKTSVDNDK